MGATKIVSTHSQKKSTSLAQEPQQQYVPNTRYNNLLSAMDSSKSPASKSPNRCNLKNKIRVKVSRGSAKTREHFQSV